MLKVRIEKERESKKSGEVESQKKYQSLLASDDRTHR